MFKAFFKSREWALYAYGGAALLLTSLYLQVQMTVALNVWYGDFNNLLQQALEYRKTPDVGKALFYDKLISLAYIEHWFNGEPSFAIIVLPYIALATATAYFTRLYGLWWREAMTLYYIPRWITVTEDIEGASQRIQEDTKRFAQIVESLGLQVARAVMTLIAFLPLLWYLSQCVEVPFIDGWTYTFLDTRGVIDARQADGVRFVVVEGLNEKGKPLIQVTNTDYVPGILVWCALSASLGGMIISWFVGWYLPKLEYNNQVKEAAFRKELVYGEDDKVNHASLEALRDLFWGVRVNYRRLYLHYGYFDLWMNLYDQCMVVVPYLVAGPSLFTGAVLLGVVAQVSNAFSRVHNGFALLIHNWPTINELRSIRLRLREFERNLDRHRSFAQ